MNQGGQNLTKLVLGPQKFWNFGKNYVEKNSQTPKFTKKKFITEFFLKLPTAP